MNIFVEDANIFSRNDPIIKPNANPNPYPNHEKMIKYNLILDITYITVLSSQERCRVFRLL